MHVRSRPEAGFAGREASSGPPVSHAEEGGWWGKHGFPHPCQPWIEAMMGIIRIATMLAILIIGLIAGPAVSL